MATDPRISVHGARRTLVVLAAAVVAATAATAAPARVDEESTPKVPRVTRCWGSTPDTVTEVVNVTRRTQSSGSYAWPLKPFDRQHPVRGFFGDPRIGGYGSKQFHFGVDVSAPNGTPVYATITGTISFLHPDAISVAGSRNVAFEYWHIVPVVRPGQRVQAYETVIGHVEKPWAHVHFSERRNGVYLNPLRAGGMGPYADETVPEVKAIRIRREGARVTMTAVVVDETPLLVPRPWSNLPVMPALVRWRLVGAGAQPTRWQTVVDFRLRIPPAASFSTVYSASTRQNHANTPGLYELRLANVPAQAGRTIEVTASDLSGNTATVRKPLLRGR